MTVAKIGWCERQRQEWIADTLRVFGFINRDHIQRKFAVSVAQASKDLQRFLRDHPDAMRYCLQAKRYESTALAIVQMGAGRRPRMGAK